MSTPTIEWSARDIEMAERVMALAETEDADLPVLTDEEIVALDGIQRDQLVALPWLAQHVEQRELLCGVALRGLLTKSLVYPVAEEGQREPTRLQASDSITGVLTLRRTGQRIVAAERTVSSGRRWLYAYIHEGAGVLEEEVDDGGVHMFTVYPLPVLAARLASFVDPDGAASGDSEARELSEAEFEALALELLGGTEASTSIAVLGGEQLESLTVFTGPSSVHTLTAAERNGAAVLTLEEVSGSSLGRKLEQLSHETS